MVIFDGCFGASSKFYPKVANIDGREQFERLLRGDVGVAPIGRDVVLRRLTDENT